MKLYFARNACSLSPHIVLREAGLPFELERVDTKTHKTRSGIDFYSINPKGYVPALQLDDGQVLTEGPAIVQYIADLKPESKLAPPPGTMDRYRLQEWLNFIGTELHKQFSPLFSATISEQMKQQLKEKIAGRFDYVSKHLEGRQFILGDTFTAADAYLFTVVSWSKFVEIDLSRWPSLKAYIDRVAMRPAVRAAIEAERA